MLLRRVAPYLVIGLLSLLLPHLGGSAAQASVCTITVSAPASIQSAVDAADPGDVVCLAGTFKQSVVFGPEDSGITLTVSEGASAILDGTGPADTDTTLLYDAIRLLDGVTNVKIEGLEIHHYTSGTCCGQGNAIQAWGVTTSSISVLRNNMHDNSWNGVLVGSEGAQVHTGWAVHQNSTVNNGFMQIELTNCSSCSIHNNAISTPSAASPVTSLYGGGLLVQARNTVPDSGLVMIQSVSVKNNQITSNRPYGTFGYPGAYLLGLASGPLPPFGGIGGAQASLVDVSLAGNQITSLAGGAVVRGYPDASPGPAQVIDAALVNNTFTCTSGYGIRLVSANVVNTKVVRNSFASSCSPALTDLGDGTKVPPPMVP